MRQGKQTATITPARMLAIAGVLSASNAFAFTLGPYRLGMSNIEAKRLAPLQCIPTKLRLKDLIVCSTTETNKLANARELGLFFDAAGKLVEVRYILRGNHTPEQFETLKHELGISDCPGEMSVPQSSIGFTCYKRPNQKLALDWHSGGGRFHSPSWANWAATLEYTNEIPAFLKANAKKGKEEAKRKANQEKARSFSSY